MVYRACVITVSDKASRNEREDKSGPALCKMLRENGFETVYNSVVPDEEEKIKDALIKACDRDGINLILTTGGTGFSKRDITPEATQAVIERFASGISEYMRYESSKITLRACLSRGVSGIRGDSLIINLPGSEKAATESLSFVIEPLKHGLDILMTQGSSDCAVSHK